MNLRIVLFVLVYLFAKQMFGQSKLRKLTAIINHPAINNFAPYISLDGNSLVYISDQAEDNAMTMTYTAREGVNWKEPVILPKPVNSKLNFLTGFALSADGKQLYITNTKSNGLGGFDIYTSRQTGNSWSELVNMGLPMNSKSNEGCPSVSAEGNVIYFMRCEKMDFVKAENCKILMMSKKPNGQWDTPVELPAQINTGNSQTPRIMGDGVTLVFSSNALKPNRGGMDLYITQFENKQWSNPRPLDFVNTPKDDQYVSATSLGRYLLRDAPGQRSSELVELLFPPEVRPKGTMKIEGTVAGVEDLSSAFITVFDLKDQNKVFSTKPGKDGIFIAYIREGSVYDLSVDPEKDNYTFYSKTFDLTGEKFSLVEKVSVNLKPAEGGDEIVLDGISFKPSTSDLNPASSQDLRRLVRLIQGNPGKSFSVLVTLFGYQKDSVKSNPDFTEMITDTLKIPVTHKVISTDSLATADSVKLVTRDSIVVRTTYHNDRTLRQAKAVGDYLIKSGVPAGRIACSGKAEPEAILENRKTLIKVVVH